MLRSGWETWFVPEASVTHYRGASGQSGLGTDIEIQDKVRGYRQAVAFIQKNYGAVPSMGYRMGMAVLFTGNLIKRTLNIRLFSPRNRGKAVFKLRLAWRMLLASFGLGGWNHNALGCEPALYLRNYSGTSMAPDKQRLAIVMQGATQFDGPLFAKLARNAQLELKVYYTAMGQKAVSRIDPELGVRPQWGEMSTSGYMYETRSPGMLGLIRFLRKIIAGQPDLIIVSGYMPILHSLVALYAWACGVPVGLRSDTTLQHSNTSSISLKGRFKRIVLKVFFRIYSTAYPVGTLAKENLLYYGFPNDRLFLFPYAVNNEWFSKESRMHTVRRAALQRELGIAEKAFVVLGILKFHQREDPVTLILGFADFMAKQHAPCHLLLVGDGPLHGELESLIHDKGITNITMPGYAPYGDLPKYFAVADVFVHPGVGESWGVSVNESMACGVPVILSDRVGSHIDLVKEGETGFVFKTKDPGSLAQCLAAMAGDRKLCGTMGDKARLLVNNWGYDATEKSLLGSLRYVSI